MKNKWVAVLFFAASAVNAATGALNYSSGNQAMGTVYVCLAAAFLALGAVYCGKKGKRKES